MTPQDLLNISLPEHDTSMACRRWLKRLLLIISFRTRVQDRLRGRILSIALMNRGTMPLGAILIGAVAEWAGALRAAVFVEGGCVAVRPQIRSL